MPKPSLRALLGGQHPVLSTFLMIPRVEVVEMLGVAGFNAVIIDIEHGPFGPADVPPLAAVAAGAGMTSIARLADGRSSSIGQALDAGVDAVMVPHVSSGADAEAAVRAARYPPEGDRSLNPYVRGTGYDADKPGALEIVNGRAAVIAMIEGQDGLHSLDEIMKVEGLDAIFIGPVDLSAALGHPGQPEHPDVQERMNEILRSAAECKVAAGVYAPSADAAARWLGRGASLVAVSADTAMMLEAFRAVRGRVEELREAGPIPG